jgi:hypothetical protein
VLQIFFSGKMASLTPKLLQGLGLGSATVELPTSAVVRLFYRKPNLMSELFIVAIIWGAVLFYIARTPKEKMQMTWLVLLALVLLSPLLALFWPAFR